MMVKKYRFSINISEELNELNTAIKIRKIIVLFIAHYYQDREEKITKR